MAAAVKRGEIWTVSGGAGYAGKPRPAVIVQDEAFSETASVTLCPFATHELDAPLLRVHVLPSGENGLRMPCDLMTDKITTVSRSKLDKRVGRLADEDMLRLNRAMLVFLGLASAGDR